MHSTVTGQYFVFQRKWFHLLPFIMLIIHNYSMYVSDKRPWIKHEYSWWKMTSHSKTQEPRLASQHLISFEGSTIPFHPLLGSRDLLDEIARILGLFPHGFGNYIYISLLQVHTKKFSSFLFLATGYLATCTFWYPSQSPLQSKWPTAPPPLVQRWKSTPATKHGFLNVSTPQKKNNMSPEK